jgi:hypothetical protein
VIGTGLAFTPDQYLGLTRGQREAVVAEANRVNRRR